MRVIKARLLVTIFVTALSALCLFSAPVFAVQSSTSEGYLVKTNVTDGALVSFVEGQAQAVEMSTLSTRGTLLGVAVKPEQALVTINNGANRIQVVTTGIASAQVSTANGPISTGDYLSVSPISGVAMKASSAGKVIGVAQGDFSTESGAGKTSIDLTDSAGKKQTVQVGRMAVKVGVEDWIPDGQPNSPILNNLRTFLGNAAGKPVSNAQALLSIGIVLLATLASGTIMYSSVSSSIRSIGRNPLSRGIIRRSLFVMLGLSAIVIIGAASAVYLILGG